MFTRTIKAVQAIAITLISFSASAQAYHHPIHADNFNEQSIIDSNNVASDSRGTNPDSSVAAHLQVSVRQTMYDNLTFRVAISNPMRKGATISISHNDETSYLAANIKGNYQNLFDLSELEDGNYTLVVTNGKEKVSKQIIISTSVKTDRQVQLN